MSNQRRKKVDLTGKTPIEIYEMVLSGKLERLPPYFWDKETAKKIVVHIYKGYSKKQLVNIHFRRDLTQKKALGALKQFHYSSFDLLTYCFPKLKIQEWELKRVPDGCWANDENIRKAVRSLAKRKKLKTKVQICSTFSADFLRDNGLRSLMEEYSILDMLKISFPEYDFIESDLIKQYKWTKEAAIKNIKHMIENVLKWDYEDVCKNISKRVFIENGLDGLLSHFCHSSVIEALDLAYPNMYKREDLKSYESKLKYEKRTSSN